jgi:hypothetical protein
MVVTLLPAFLAREIAALDGVSATPKCDSLILRGGRRFCASHLPPSRNLNRYLGRNENRPINAAVTVTETHPFFDTRSACRKLIRYRGVAPGAGTDEKNLFAVRRKSNVF